MAFFTIGLFLDPSCGIKSCIQCKRLSTCKTSVPFPAMLSKLKALRSATKLLSSLD
ncbi:MAG: hypothetical protein R2801_10940 [Chitinophagales bacterium]